MLSNTLQEATGISAEEAAMSVLSNKRASSSAEGRDPASVCSPQVTNKLKPIGSEGLGLLGLAAEDCMLWMDGIASKLDRHEPVRVCERLKR